MNKNVSHLLLFMYHKRKAANINSIDFHYNIRYFLAYIIVKVPMTPTPLHASPLNFMPTRVVQNLQLLYNRKVRYIILKFPKVHLKLEMLLPSKTSYCIGSIDIYVPPNYSNVIWKIIALT